MCLYPVSGPHIAKEDLTVYKIIDYNCHSIIMNFSYTPNTFYCLGWFLFFKKLTVEKDEYEAMKINKGFHAYTDLISLTKQHGYLSHREKREKIVKFFIPKGAQYYLGDRGDIVSNKIISGDLKAI